MHLSFLALVVHAADWSLKSESEKFDEFVKAVQEAPTMEDTPLSGWLVPTWRKQMESVEVPNEELWFPSNDSELQANLASLVNPTLEVGAWSAQIKETLQEKGKRILAVLSKSPSADVLEGLRGYAQQLVDNTKWLAAWCENDWNRQIIALRPATLIGICQTRELSQMLLRHLVQFVLKGQSPYKAMEGLQLNFSVGFASLLSTLSKHLTDLPPTVGDLITRLQMIDAFYLNNNDADFLEMIPLGQRLAIGTVSKAGYAAIVDMIKAEDGFIYGIKYATDESTHAHTIAFRLPKEKLSQLVEFLGESYSFFNDIGSIKGIKCQSVKLKWYPLGPIKNPTAMVLGYAVGGHATQEHYVMGAVLKYCQELTSSTGAPNLQRDILEMTQNLSPSAAGKLHEIVAGMSHGKTDAALLLEIIASLHARSLAI